MSYKGDFFIQVKWKITILTKKNRTFVVNCLKKIK